MVETEYDPITDLKRSVRITNRRISFAKVGLATIQKANPPQCAEIFNIDLPLGELVRIAGCPISIGKLDCPYAKLETGKGRCRRLAP